MFSPAPISLGVVGNGVLWKIRSGQNALAKTWGCTVGIQKGDPWVAHIPHLVKGTKRINNDM